MTKYEELLHEAINDGISVDEDYSFKGEFSGLYIDGNIALSDRLHTTTEKACVLAEEMGHHYTSVGNILDMSDTRNRKQERQARLWAYNKLIGLSGIIEAFEHGCQSRFEIAEYLDVTEEFLEECLACYRNKYGVGTTLDNYYIMFIPNLNVGRIDFSM